MTTLTRALTAGAAAALAAGTALAFAPVTPAGAAPAHTVAVAPAHGQAIAGHYVVTVAGGGARAAAAAAHVAPRLVFGAALHGFAAALDARQLDALRHDPRVTRIEQDGVVHANAVPWGLDRIDQHNLPLDGLYHVPATGGTGTTAYVIDTGITVSNAEFGGRAAVAYDALGGDGLDCNGHGTAVAGVVGSQTYGVAKSVALRAVRVLDCSGSGSTSAVIAGIDWVASHHAARSVANISLGGGLSSAMNTAVTNLANSGVFVAVAAGASASNACNYSPASATGAFAVAASTSADASASFNNYGSCVDLYAPGSNIQTIGGTYSGNSFSAAFVTGAAALYKWKFGEASWQTITSWLVTNATSGVLTGVPVGSPNKLLYVGGLV